SLMATATVARLIERIAANWGYAADAEITLEANPTSVEAGKFSDFSRAGINRLSLGVQALNDADLKALGREHNLREAQKAIDLSQKYFSRSSFDLIYARMGQTVADWEKELTGALTLTNGHLSLYQLTIERGTAFYHARNKGRLILPDDDISADLYQLTQQLCQAHGLPAYEISNHAAVGQESRHNLAYWHYDDYIGVGPGAHGRLTIDGGLYAVCQHRSPEKWLDTVTQHGHATDQKAVLTSQEKAEEMLMMGLRLTAGIDLDNFERRVGEKIDKFIDYDWLQNFLELDYMEMGAHHLQVTARGLPLLNGLLARIL
ncbi:MAG: radical SAM family heme chaperone HemW, partial [Alphaproteobacteria bacterium]|nr:radical SAM family heme chaperone HemW [Alphaproteobacteria bacterium]